MYSLRTSMIIAGMVLTGTARSVGVKVFYQLGCDNPMFVALLYLVGQSMSLIVAWLNKHRNESQNAVKGPEYAPIDGNDDEETSLGGHSDQSGGSPIQKESNKVLPLELESEQLTEGSSTTDQTVRLARDTIPLTNTRRPQLRRQGSNTGLSEESHDAVAWVHSIPWYVKPLIPGLFNLANAALKWASFIFVAASVAEMLMSGLEIVLSTIVARIVRKRRISNGRWVGVLVVVAGLLAVHTVELWGSSVADAEQTTIDDTSHRREHVIGSLLIVGQCVTAVGQDIAEELFLQEADFPAALLLGMEGVIGLIFGIPLYVLYFAPEPPRVTIDALLESDWKMAYAVFLVFLFMVTGIFNILTTGVTSSMTRNMWKNCRTLMVWLVGLGIYYSQNGSEKIMLGEPWKLPESFFTLCGFLLMLAGIYVYYKNK